MPDRSYVVFTSTLRSNQIERYQPGPAGWDVSVLALRASTDLDAAVLAAAPVLVRMSTLPGALLRLFLCPPDLLEVPEPMWWRYLPVNVAAVCAARAGRFMRGRRQPLVVTCAIENFPVRDGLRASRAGVPIPLRAAADRLLKATAGAAFRLYDLCFWCTAAAEANYRESFTGQVARWTTETRQELMPRCGCAPEPGAGKSQTVLFCAEFAVRKGIDVLLDAWPAVAAARPGWTLALFGYGPRASEITERAGGMTGVTVTVGADRDAIHGAFAAAATVVLPSVREGYWQEQVGLPMLEGLAHGCAVVTTTETGAAGWLTANGQRVVAPGDAGVLAQVLLAATAVPPATRYVDLPSIDTRTAFEAWAMDQADMRAAR